MRMITDGFWLLVLYPSYPTKNLRTRVDVDDVALSSTTLLSPIDAPVEAFAILEELERRSDAELRVAMNGVLDGVLCPVADGHVLDQRVQVRSSNVPMSLNHHHHHQHPFQHFHFRNCLPSPQSIRGSTFDSLVSGNI